MLSDVLQDPKTAMSTSPDDSAFHRGHGISLFDYYDTVRNMSGLGIFHYRSPIILYAAGRREI